LTALSVFFALGAAIFGTGALMGSIFYFMEGDVHGWDRVKNWKSPIKKLWAITAIFGMLTAMTPTTKQAAVIWLLPKVVNNEQVQAIPHKALRLLNKQMDEWLEDNLKIEEKNETNN
jgi:hypothetical protein